MNNELEQKRLKFAVGRAETSLGIKSENLIVKSMGISGRRCQNGREEFAFHRNEHIVEYDFTAGSDAEAKAAAARLEELKKETAAAAR